MDKIEKDYEEKHGDVSKNLVTRINDILKTIKSPKVRSKLTSTIEECFHKKWKRIDFIIYLEPKATPRARCNRKSNIFYVKGAADNKKRFKKFLKKIEYEQIVTPTKFTAVAYLPIPKDMNAVDRLLCELGFGYPLKKPDGDNLIKTYMDMMQSELLSDDAIVVDMICRKRYSTKPRIEISIEYMDGFDIQYNYLKYQKKKG